jgi:hypothetical protein
LELPGYQDHERIVSGSQWQVVEKIIDDQRQRWHPLRTIANAILSINRTGANWIVNIHLGKACIITFASSNYAVFGQAAVA